MNDITKTETEVRNGITYITHYIDRPIRLNDPLGGSQGITKDGKETTTVITQYIYKGDGDSISK